MQTITITKLRKTFYKTVDKTSKGQELIITKYGKPISKLIPINKSQPSKFLKYKS